MHSCRVGHTKILDIEITIHFSHEDVFTFSCGFENIVYIYIYICYFVIWSCSPFHFTFLLKCSDAMISYQSENLEALTLLLALRLLAIELGCVLQTSFEDFNECSQKLYKHAEKGKLKEGIA